MAVNSPSVIQQDQDFLGNIRMLGTLALPKNTVGNVNLAVAGSMDSGKLEHLIDYRKEVIGTITAQTLFLGAILSNFSDIYDMEASVQTTIPTSSAAVSIDLQMASDGGTFATILTTPITLNSSSVLCTLQSAVINSSLGSSLTGKKHLKVVITLSGSGTQAADVCIIVRTKHRSIAVGT